MPARQFKIYSWVVIDPGPFDGFLDFETIFGRSAPLHIEIGSGRGTFLIHQARAFANLNFLGIEWASKYYRYSVDRVGRHDLRNVRLTRTDAAAFIQTHIPDGSVDCYHIYYPDPWPKKRHHKRRFVTDDNVDRLYQTLKPGGRVQLATDHADYYEQMCRVFDQNRNRFEAAEFEHPAGAGKNELVGTNYERKYVKEGREKFALAVRKI